MNVEVAGGSIVQTFKGTAAAGVRSQQDAREAVVSWRLRVCETTREWWILGYWVRWILVGILGLGP